jgi:hypothetical protein
MILC